MDRLSALILVLAACGNDAKEPPASRSETGKVAQKQTATTEEFCDFKPGRETPGPELTWAALVPGQQAPAPAKGWRWLNIWATWCAPCVEELPRLVRWQKKLPDIDLQFVSIDEKQEDVDAYRQKHADAPTTLRLADPEKINVWTTALGLTGSPPIPIHVFVDPTNHVRCARAGSVREQDFAIVQQLLSGR